MAGLWSFLFSTLLVVSPTRALLAHSPSHRHEHHSCHAALGGESARQSSEVQAFLQWGDTVLAGLKQSHPKGKQRKWRRGIEKRMDKLRKHPEPLARQFSDHRPIVSTEEWAGARKKVLEIQEFLKRRSPQSSEYRAFLIVLEEVVALNTVHFLTYLDNKSYRRTEGPRLKVILEQVNQLSLGDENKARWGLYKIHKSLKQFYSSSEFRNCR